MQKFKQQLYDKIQAIKLSSNLQGIYFKVPTNSEFPYIYIGDFNVSDCSSKLKRKHEIRFKVVIYYRVQGAKMRTEIFNQLSFEIIKELESIPMLFFLKQNSSLTKEGIGQITNDFKVLCDDI